MGQSVQRPYLFFGMLSGGIAVLAALLAWWFADRSIFTSALIGVNIAALGSMGLEKSFARSERPRASGRQPGDPRRHPYLQTQNTKGSVSMHASRGIRLSSRSSAYAGICGGLVTFHTDFTLEKGKVAGWIRGDMAQNRWYLNDVIVPVR